MAKQKEMLTPKQEEAADLFMKYYSLVRHTAMISAPMMQLRDDIVHDAFVNFMENANQYDLTTGVGELLRTITINCARAAWRKYLEGLSDPFGKIAEYARREMKKIDQENKGKHLDDELMALNLCMNSLTPRSRELIERHYFDRVSIVNLAKEMKIGLEALYKMVLRIRTSLKTCITKTLRAGGEDV